jgi:Zn-dependent alcohol dehydrogenase
MSTGAGVALVVGKNVQSVEVGDPVLLSFYSCSTCTQCEASHPAYCDSFASKNYIGSQGSMKLSKDSTRVWSQFFGQSSFAQYSTVNKSSIVNAKDLIEDLNELKLFAPLGCGFQTGMGAINIIAQAGPNDSVMISGLGAVGMGALMVSCGPLQEKFQEKFQEKCIRLTFDLAQTAKITKCKVIIAVDRVQTRLELARRLGATHTINTNDAEISRLDDAVRAIVPKGASVAIDTTGVPSIIEQSVQSTHARGKVIFIGIPPKNYTLNINLSEHMNVRCCPCFKPVVC